MAWVEPIYDRTESDVVYARNNQSSISTELKGSMDYRTLNRIEGNTIVVSEKLNSYGYANQISTKTDWDRNDVMGLSEINRIESNINLLQEVFLDYKANSLQSISFTTPITYDIINSIEKMIYDTNALYDGMMGGLQRLSFKLGTKKI